MSTTYLLLGGLFLLAVASLILAISLHVRMYKLFRGSKAQSLESLMADIVKEVERLNGRANAHAVNLEELEQRLVKHGRGVRLVRFNPFADVGGNHSFAVAIVNKEGDGVVFSSLYSRDRMSVFAKPVHGGASDIELTPEEAAVVKDAQQDASF